VFLVGNVFDGQALGAFTEPELQKGSFFGPFDPVGKAYHIVAVGARSVAHLFLGGFFLNFHFFV